MAMNPASIMKLMAAKSQFENAHPGVSGFVKNVISQGLPEGTVLEINVTRPDGSNMATNMKVLPSDIELFNELKNVTS